MNDNETEDTRRLSASAPFTPSTPATSPPNLIYVEVELRDFTA